MKNLLISTLACASMLTTLAHSAWLPIVDFSNYTVGDGEAELHANGWNFVDDNFYGFVECVDGRNDCTGVREVVDTPYSATTGSEKSMMIRGGDPSQSLVANGGAANGILLPQEIPVGGKATIYMHAAMENKQGVRVFGVSPDEVVHETGGFQFSSIGTYIPWDAYLRVNQGSGSINAYVNPSLPDPLDYMVSEEWYDIWLHVDNQSLSTGDGLGGRFDFYIRGGIWDEITHLTNTDVDFINAEYTAWIIRTVASRQVDAPLKTFALIAQAGHPDDPKGLAAFYMNSVQMMPSEFSFEVPGVTVETWNGYTVTNGWADTGDWMGYVYVSNDPWLYSYDLSTWVYSGSVEADGGWIYVLK